VPRVQLEIWVALTPSPTTRLARDRRSPASPRCPWPPGQGQRGQGRQGGVAGADRPCVIHAASVSLSARLEGNCSNHLPIGAK
jgi:hypothetical protein